MNLLFRLVFATYCRSTHHKIAMEALFHLRGPDACRWQRFFLAKYGEYLRGAKAPDREFRDFRNHVLHVSDNCWGGAPRAARKWYEQTVTALREHRFDEAAFAAGVMSHYYTDPIQPFHTAQSKAETNIHRATEWSITKSYDAISQQIELKLGYPDIEVPPGDDWLEAMVVAGAEASHRYYDALVERYDFATGASDPPAGLDEICREFLAGLVAHAQVGFARILDRAVDEANIMPPPVLLTPRIFLATLQAPIRTVIKKLADVKDQIAVQAMFDEYQATGQVEVNLAEDERTVRACIESDQNRLKMPGTQVPSTPTLQRETTAPMPTSTVPASTVSSTPTPAPTATTSPRLMTPRPRETEPKPVSALHRSNEPALPARAEKPDEFRYYLQRSSDVEDGPSIGPKTARRLAKVGIDSVSDLLAADPERTARELDVRHIQADTIRDWQDQAALVCRIAHLRGHDAQILVGCGYREAAQVAAADPDQLLGKTNQFVKTSEGQRVIRSSKKPDREEVCRWIRFAQAARALNAA